MRYADFQRTVDESGLSLREFARLLRLNPNSITNYKKRLEVPSHLGVIALLVHELAQRDIDFRAIIQRAAVKPKARRGSSQLMFGRARDDKE